MKRVLTIVLALAFVCSLGASAAYAGPGCCKSKMDGKDTKLSSMTACAMGEFPHLTMVVGDKEYDCPASAEKDAEAKGAKVRFIVVDEQFDCKDKAMIALAGASERYVKRYTTVAALVDGKLIYNQEDVAGCKVACSEGKAALASTGEGSSCSKAKAALASAGEGKTCSASKAAELAKAEGSGCSKAKAALASAEGKTEGSSCSKAKAALASASGSGCCKSGAAGRTAMAVVSKDEFAKLAKTEGTKFLVVGRSFDCYDSATKARDNAIAAIKIVKMKYIVDGKEVGCSSEICPTAKKAGKVQYVVGEDKTCCETSARVSLAKAQYDAAKKAADQKVAQM